MHLYTRIISILLFLLIGNISAQNTKNIIVKNPLGITSFIENNGQWPKINSKIPILFQTEQDDQFISLTKDGFYWEAYFRKLKHKNELEHESELEHEKKEEESKFDYTKKFIQFKLLNCNRNPKILKQQKTRFYFSYGDKELTSWGYHKIVYQNIYPNIDWIVDIDSISGMIHYSFELRQNSNINDIQIQYLGDHKLKPLLAENKLYINNFPFVMQDSGLTAFDSEKKPIHIQHKINQNKVKYAISNYNIGQPLTIDPWVKKVYLAEDDSFYTSVWYFKNKNNPKWREHYMRQPNNIPIKINYDYNNNCIVYGGPLYPSQPKIAQYNANGQLKWMFMGSVPSINFKYVYSAVCAMGSIYTQKNSCKIFTCNGFDISGAKTIRLDDSGHYDNYITSNNWDALEGTDIQINCRNNLLYIGAGSSTSSINYTVASIDSINSIPKSALGKNIHGYDANFQDVVQTVLDDSGYCYYLSSGKWGPNPYTMFNALIKTDIIHKLVWKNKTGFYSTEELSNHPNRKAWITANSANVLALNQKYLFYYDGKYLAAYSKYTGNHVGNVDSSSKKIAMDIQGIAVDECNRVYVGGDSATIRIYNFNGSNFKLDTILKTMSTPTAQQVNDVRINVSNGLIFFCGDSLLGIVKNPYSCIDSSYFSHNPKKSYQFCQNQSLIASIIYPDTSEIYTFQWIDSAKNEMVRNVSIRHKFSDTFPNPKAFKTYKVNITKTKTTFCGGDYSQLTFKTFPTQDSTIFDTLCQGQSFVLRKRSFLSDTTFTDTLVNLYGCDSIMTYKLHFLKKSFFAQKIVICKGDTLRVGPKSYVSSGSFIDTLVNAVGCDSVVSTALTVSYDSISQNIHVCNTYFYQVGNQSYYKPGIYVAKFKNRFGCDSIIRTVLTMASDTIIRRKKTLCSGDVYTVGTNTYTKSGVYRDTFKRFNGCDSFVQSTLKFISDTTISQSISICQGDSLKVGKNVYRASDNYNDSLKKFLGCDSVIHTKLSVYPKYTQNKLIRLCPKESIVINGVNYNKSQNFKYRYTSVNGCDSVVEFNIIKSDLESIFDIDSTKTPAITFNNTSKKDVKFYWKFDQSTVDSINRKVTKNYPNDSNRTFEICLIVKDSFGCVDTICQQLKMSKLMYYLFNTFTPNNDGYNDVYNIKTVGGSLQYSLEVYSRWGVKVFEVRDANSSDQSKLWNGKVMNNGADCPSGSYFALFRLYLNGSSKDPEIVNGVIMLIRE